MTTIDNVVMERKTVAVDGVGKTILANELVDPDSEVSPPFEEAPRNAVLDNESLMSPDILGHVS